MVILPLEVPDLHDHKCSRGRGDVHPLSYISTQPQWSHQRPLPIHRQTNLTSLYCRITRFVYIRVHTFQHTLVTKKVPFIFKNEHLVHFPMFAIKTCATCDKKRMLGCPWPPATKQNHYHFVRQAQMLSETITPSTCNTHAFVVIGCDTNQCVSTSQHHTTNDFTTKRHSERRHSERRHHTPHDDTQQHAHDKTKRDVTLHNLCVCAHTQQLKKRPHVHDREGRRQRRHGRTVDRWRTRQHAHGVP